MRPATYSDFLGITFDSRPGSWITLLRSTPSSCPMAASRRSSAHWRSPEIPIWSCSA